MIKKWSFDNDELFVLVASNRKHGTCCLYTNDDNMSKVGEKNIIYNSRGDEITIQITNVRKCRFCDVDEQWAQCEGEGDLSLQYWRDVHQKFFISENPYFIPTDMLELDEFVVIK